MDVSARRTRPDEKPFRSSRSLALPLSLSLAVVVRSRGPTVFFLNPFISSPGPVEKRKVTSRLYCVHIYPRKILLPRAKPVRSIWRFVSIGCAYFIGTIRTAGSRLSVELNGCVPAVPRTILANENNVISRVRKIT